MIHPEIDKRLLEIVALLRKHGVSKAYIFGSALTPRFKKGSDVDFLIAFKEGISAVDYADHFWSIYTELSQILGHKVDLVVEDTLQNPFFIEELNETKHLIYDEASEEIPV